MFIARVDARRPPAKGETVIVKNYASCFFGTSLAVAAIFGQGTPEQIGQLLFTTYLLPFEVTSIILLVAIIGVIVLNQRRKGLDDSTVANDL